MFPPAVSKQCRRYSSDILDTRGHTSPLSSTADSGSQYLEWGWITGRHVAKERLHFAVVVFDDISLIFKGLLCVTFKALHWYEID